MKKAMTAAVGVLAASGLAACEVDETATTSPTPFEPAFAKSGFVTGEPLQAMFAPGFSGDMKALATVDDELPGGERLAGTLDGIGVWGGQSTLNLLVTHELSTSQGGSRVSHMTIDAQSSGGDSGQIIYMKLEN